MINVLLAVLFALGLLTSGGVTVAASQTATPDDVLYPVRVWSEDARLALADSETKSELAVKFAENYLDLIKEDPNQATETVMNRFAYMFAYANAFQNGVDLVEGNGAYNFEDTTKKMNNANVDPATTEPKGEQVHDRLQTLVDDVQELTATGVIDPVYIRKTPRDRANVNATTTGLQARSENHLSMPGDADGDEPIVPGNGIGIPCDVDTDGDGTIDKTGYYCYQVYGPTDGSWYWYYGEFPYSAEGIKPVVTMPRFPTLPLGPGPGPGSSNGSSGSKK